MINGKVFTAPTAVKFLGNLKMRAKTTDRLEGTKKVISAALRGVRHAFEAVGKETPASGNSLGSAPNIEPLGETYYSVTPFRYGDYHREVQPKAGRARADRVNSGHHFD